MKLFKNIFVTVIVLFALWFFIYGEEFLSNNNAAVEYLDNIRDNIKDPYTYNDYDKCRTNMDCWKEVIDDLVNTAVNDASDGIIDKDYYRPRKNIWDAADKLIDENMKYEISRYSVNKLDSIPYNLKQSIMDNFGLVFN